MSLFYFGLAMYVFVDDRKEKANLDLFLFQDIPFFFFI